MNMLKYKLHLKIGDIHLTDTLRIQMGEFYTESEREWIIEKAFSQWKNDIFREHQSGAVETWYEEIE